jgi:hypothetical protein
MLFSNQRSSKTAAKAKKKQNPIAYNPLSKATTIPWVSAILPRYNIHTIDPIDENVPIRLETKPCTY